MPYWTTVSTATAEKMTRKYLLIAGLIAWLASTSAIAAELLDRIIAVAGEDVVMLSELRSKAQQIVGELRQANTNPMPSQDRILSRALDELILEKLQLAEAQRLGIEADQDTVAQAISRIAENNRLSVPQLREALASEGMDFRQFQNKIRNQLIMRRLINREVTNRIQISKSEVDQHLARQEAAPQARGQVRLLHILISTPDGASPQQIGEAGQKAQAARQRIDNGEDFRAVAQAMSDGPRAINGGDTGWLDIAGLPPGFIEFVSELQPGQLQGPFRSANGFHIIKAEGFRQSDIERQIVRQTHARHILIRTDEITSDDDARERLNQLRERALQGDDFANLARSSSADQASAIKGGDLGWVSPGNMVAEFEEQMNRTPVDAISEPFKTRFGWHIVQVLGHRDHDETEEARRIAAREAVRERKAEEATEQYLRRLRDEAYVELRLQVEE